MSYNGGAAAAAAAIAKATKASGVLVSVSPDDFMKIIQRADRPVVVMARGGFMLRKYRYLTSYKGLAFVTLSESVLYFSGGIELIAAQKIWIPN
nr:hypothetical protein [candidate division Zixibacteria bacterium]